MDDLDLGATIKGFRPGQKIFGRYTLKAQLGRGGMGVVWRARDESLERDVAIKMLPEVVANDPSAVRDLKRETAKSQQLSHPHILRIYDFVEAGPLCGITMELVEGGTLTAKRLEQPGEVFTVESLREWVGQLCEALEYAHSREKIVHRDLKPANLMLTADGQLKVADFGIAASVSDSVSRVSQQTGSSGTPVYMSPQQMMGERPAVSDDIYALGATLYELLTGKPPFYSGNIIMQVQNKVPPSVTERLAELDLNGDPIPPAWEATIAACLAKAPQDRPQGAGEVLERLGLAARNTKDTKPEATVERAVPQPLKAQAMDGTVTSRSTSKTPLFAGIFAGVVLLGGLGWYFGMHAPEQRRLQADQQLAAEQQRQREADLAAERGRLEVDITRRLAGLQLQVSAMDARLVAATERMKVLESRAKEAAAGNAALFAEERRRLFEEFTAWLRDGVAAHPGRVALAGVPDLLRSGNLTAAESLVRESEAEITNWRGWADAGEAQRYLLPLSVWAEGHGQNLIDLVRQDEPAAAMARLNQLRSGLSYLDDTPPKWREGAGEFSRLAAWAGWDDPGLGRWLDRWQVKYRIESQPAEADVFVGDKKVGRTPYVQRGYPGEAIAVRVAKEGYRRREILQANASQWGQVETLNARLEQLEERAVQLDLGGGVDLKLYWIPQGEFLMGYNGEIKATDFDQPFLASVLPATRVRLSHGFWIGRTTVTVGQYRRFVDETRYQTLPEQDNKIGIWGWNYFESKWQAWTFRNSNWRAFTYRNEQNPVVAISYRDAVAFCEWLTAREKSAGRLPVGYVYMLPSEAQWEYAVRADTTTPWFFGDNSDRLSDYGWFYSADFSPKAVGQKPANPWGLHDVYGNVLEMTRTWYANYPGGSLEDYEGPAGGSDRVGRGGHHYSNAHRFSPRSGVSSFYREKISPNFCSTYLGFRVALVPEPKR